MERFSNVLRRVSFGFVGSSSTKNSSSSSSSLSTVSENEDSTIKISDEINYQYKPANSSQANQNINSSSELSSSSRSEFTQNNTRNRVSACPLCQCDFSHQHVTRFDPKTGLDSRIVTLVDRGTDSCTFADDGDEKKVLNERMELENQNNNDNLENYESQMTDDENDQYNTNDSLDFDFLNNFPVKQEESTFLQDEGLFASDESITTNQVKEDSQPNNNNNNNKTMVSGVEKVACKEEVVSTSNSPIFSPSSSNDNSNSNSNNNNSQIFSSLPSSSSSSSSSNDNSNSNNNNNIGVASSSVSSSDPEPTTFKCPRCRKYFADRAQMELHASSKEECRRFRCRFCPAAYFYNANCWRHERQIHPREAGFMCVKCGVSFTSKAILREHRATECVPPSLPVSIFQEINPQSLPTTTTTTLQARLFAKNLFKCTYCGKFLTSRSGLVEHIRTHTGEKPFKCPQCQRGFAKQFNMKTHLKRCQEIAPYPNQPSQTTTNQTTQRSNQSVSSFQYNQQTDSNLTQSHAASENREESANQFQCFTCGQVFTEMAQMLIHLSSHNEWKHECPLCGKCYAEANDLTEHIRIHFGGQNVIITNNQNQQQEQKLQNRESSPSSSYSFANESSLFNEVTNQVNDDDDEVVFVGEVPKPQSTLESRLS